MPDLHVTVDDQELRVPAGTLVAAAVALAGRPSYRRSVQGEPRGPLCGMGICFECRVTIDDQPQRLSCQIVCRDGMRVQTQ
jgi:hypothetical protein